ncbi:MAG: hypothetical protein PVJ76_14405 [Gemmatimonadota bacterium]
MRSCLLALFALFFSGACYRYVPVERYQAPRGSEVRVILTMDGEDEIRGTFGPGVTFLDGPLVRWDAEGLGLSTDLSISRDGYPSTTMTDTIQLQPHHIARVELKELDGRRTAFFTAGVVGVAAVAIIAPSLVGGESDDSGEGDDTDPDAAIVLFRIPIRIGGGGE